MRDLICNIASAEKAAVAARPKEIFMGTPAVGAPLAHQETFVLKELARAELGGEVSEWLVSSPRVPPCML